MPKRTDSKAGAKRVEMEERAQKALDYRRQGLSFAQIGAQLGIDKVTAYRDVTRQLSKLAEQNAGLAAEYRALELERLDDLERTARRILTTRHVQVSHGRVVRGIDVDPRTGEVQDTTLEDDAPVLAAVQALLRIGERRARLLGLDAPRVTELTGLDGEPLMQVSTEDLAAKFDALVRAQAERLEKPKD